MRSKEGRMSPTRTSSTSFALLLCLVVAFSAADAAERDRKVDKVDNEGSFAFWFPGLAEDFYRTGKEEKEKEGDGERERERERERSNSGKFWLRFLLENRRRWKNDTSTSGSNEFELKAIPDTGSSQLRTRFEPEGKLKAGFGGKAVEFFLVIDNPPQWNPRKNMNFLVEVRKLKEDSKGQFEIAFQRVVLPLVNMIQRQPTPDLTSPGATVELKSPRCNETDPETNKVKPCRNQTWSARFWTWDSGDGLAGISVRGEGGADVSYSHPRFNVGDRAFHSSSNRVSVIASASCCTPAFTMRAWDVRANVLEIRAAKAADSGSAAATASCILLLLLLVAVFSVTTKE